MYRTGTKTVAERYGHIICGEYLADFVKVGVEEVFLIVHHGPTGHDGAAARHDAGKTFLDHVGMGAERTGVDCEVVYALLGLLDESVTVYFPCEVFDAAVDFLECLIYGNRSYRHRTVADNPLSCLVDIVACREVHQRVSSPVAAPHGFAHFFLDA